MQRFGIGCAGGGDGGEVIGKRFADAVAYALDAHGAQTRKGTDIPYACHLLGVASIVIECGGDEDLAIAALLHDCAEDHGGEVRLADIEARFGARVARIVRECSDSLEADDAPKQDWLARKRSHLQRLEEADDDVLLVWGADKLHNGRAIVVDLRVHGPSAMDRFRAPDQVLWYYRANLELLDRHDVTPQVIVPLRAVVDELAELLAPDPLSGA